MQRHSVTVEGLDLSYLEAGEGPPVLLLHGWPTSSELYRHALSEIGKHRRAIALDLPGFGQSAKPLDASYSFRFYDRVLTGFLDALGIEQTGLVVHDLGGPLGLHWLASHRDRVSDLTLLNTLVFPEMSWAVKAFVAAAWTPGIRSVLASRWGIEQSMKFGLCNPERHQQDILDRYTAPFATQQGREALLRTAYGLHPSGFDTVASSIEGLEIPVRLIYGESDRILPDVAQTMARVQALLPHAELTSIPSCGHFLQEDQPERVTALLATSLAAMAR